jgi:hypothetical protein
MHESYLYEYAVIRVIPRLEREEFVNVGVILFCKRKNFLQMRYLVVKEKIQAICKEFDIEQVAQNLESFQLIAEGNKKAGPIAALEVSERFRWITAVKSSSIQTSRPHPGYTQDLETTFERLYRELVL